MAGKDVLEVGSLYGVGGHYLAESMQPKSYVATDIATNALSYVRYVCS